MNAPQPQISILIASIGRESLAETLVSVRQAARKTGLPYEIVVADDSPAGKVAPIAARVADADANDITIIRTASANIATARNACVAASRGALLAFIDDDEWAENDWLLDHLATLETFSADASIGSVRAHYPADAPRWVRLGDPYSRRWGSPGSPLRRGSTANAVVRRAALAKVEGGFDERFGRTGGEDADLFGRVVRAGARIVASDALVSENVPLARISMRDLLQRALRVGQTFARSELAGKDRLTGVFFYVAAAGKTVVLASAAAATWPFASGRALPMLLDAIRNLGKLREAAGLPMVVYYAPRAGGLNDRAPS